jgi:hypothetical protein
MVATTLAPSWSRTTPQTPSRQPYPDGLTSPAEGRRPIPSVVRSANDRQTELQRFAGESVTPSSRWAFVVYAGPNRPRPNYNYDPGIDNAVHWSETIERRTPFYLPFIKLTYC